MLQASESITHTSASNTPSNGDQVENPETTFLKEFLPEVAKTIGLTLNIDTMDSYFEIRSEHQIDNIRASSAWAMFTVEVKATKTRRIIKTKTIEDRNTFLKWCHSPVKKLFSRKKGEENLFGPPGVTFVMI